MARNFTDDLVLGKEAEDRILKQIQKKYKLAHGIDAELKAYDIFIPELDCGIEVKHDCQAHETGNILIEYSCNGIPSGIITTRARVWVYETKFVLLWLETCQIKNMIIEYETRRWRGIPRDATSEVEAHIIPLEIAKKYTMLT
tara:strand:- start:469 stop:897 length:429 start_codon:yes stop_codon:yes gene_type:complete